MLAAYRDGTNVGILGMVDRATGYHQAAAVRSRESAHYFELLNSTWLKPLGLPWSITCDPDTSFQGDFQNTLQKLGVLVDYCPAEGHWVIGSVERRNAILRSVMERLIDQWGAATPEEVDQLLAPALHAVNSFVFNHGRSAFQAVFGRIPRLPGGVLSDQTALASSAPTLEDNYMAKGEIIRSEALKCLLDLNVSQHLRRAMLRKTVKTRVPELLPGQPCAYWRWNKKGAKKRGAWTIARFLSWDPSSPGKMAWLRTGTTTVLVAVQLRAAFGFESWSPSEEDVKAIKDASASSIFEDEVGPHPQDEITHSELGTLYHDNPYSTRSSQWITRSSRNGAT